MELGTILYAEDDKFDVELTKEVLKARNVLNPLVVVSDGIEALEYLRQEGAFEDRTPGNPCMILLDINMPRMDGLAFLKIIKEDERYSKIPVIILTSSDEEKDLVKGYDLGIIAYVKKPSVFNLTEHCM